MEYVYLLSDTHYDMALSVGVSLICLKPFVSRWELPRVKSGLRLKGTVP
jgi:hypothetical protein